MATTDISQLIEQLNHKSSPKRRAAAKKLRKLKAKEAGPALLEALQTELKDKRTWETQYQEIMALGEVECIESLEFLSNLAHQPFEATMVYVAIGDAITRLTLLKENQEQRLINMIDGDYSPMLVNGVLRAIAMLRICPEPSDIEKIITYGNTLDINSDSRVWIAAAAAGWPKEIASKYLNDCLASDNQQIQRAAEAALKNKYIKWSPL